VLEANGNYSLGELHFTQQNVFKKFGIGDARFTKAAGEGEELVITTLESRHILKYENGIWHEREEPGLLHRLFGRLTGH
jgi:hypothetical protein